MLDDFPATHGQERENLILDIIQNKQDRVSFDWVPLEISDGSNKIKLFVMKDALKIDGVRINVTATTEQKIADFLGASLLTAKICDLIWHNADLRINPCPRKISSTTKDMIEHSQEVDKKTSNFNGLISTVGKDWVLDNKTFGKNLACNHGWHYDTGTTFQGIKGNINPSLLKNPKTGQYWYLIQARGTRHDTAHTDYSQVCRLMTRECEVNSVKKDILDVFKDIKLASLINNDGVLKVLRVSGVSEPKEQIII